MVDETSEEKVEDTLEVEKAVNYICIKECFWNKVYKLGDDLTFKGDHPMLKLFKVKEEGGPVEEVLEDGEPTTLAGIAEHEALETIKSVKREGLDEGLNSKTLDAAQAPVVESPVAEEVVQTEEVPTKGLGAEPGLEEILEYFLGV